MFRILKNSGWQNNNTPCEKKTCKRLFFQWTFNNNFLHCTTNNCGERDIENTNTVKWHFAKCNNSKCNSIFLVNPAESPGDLGYICPDCSTKTTTSHVVQCSSCRTILNFVRAAPNEEKVVFNVPKCSHCIGTVEDEWEIEPLYQRDSYI